MSKILRALFILAVATVAVAGFSGCSDALIANRDDQHTPSVPPAEWENNPMGLPTQSSGSSRPY